MHHPQEFTSNKWPVVPLNRLSAAAESVFLNEKSYLSSSNII
jgi:hypothetical protein